eukprot:TRINITY_DN6183_c0_g1_i2.p1 TRINITY_DN6183_c0_g1~~TRINITY_DN6183_c0_g1_i2.p1  ORF type:complete len:336 (-),score=29.44 TRINITY_DN6183_c0_g1_i2:77-1084(-)
MECVSSLSSQEALIVSYTTLVAAVLSLLGASFMIVNYLLFSQGKGISKIVIFLAISDFGWAAVEVIAYSIIISRPELYTTKLCHLFRLLWQFFSGSSVFWTLCISIYLYYNISSLGQENGCVPSSVLNFIFHAISWGLPIIISLVVWRFDLFEDFPGLHICVLREPYHMILWSGPILLAMLFTAFTYCILIKLFLKHSLFTNPTSPQHSNSTPSGKNSLIFRVAMYLLVFVVCWTPSMTSYFIQYWSKCVIFPLVLVSEALLQLQGAFDCLVYGLTNKQLRSHYSNPLHGLLTFLFSPILIIPSLVTYIRRRSILADSRKYKILSQSREASNESK